MTKGGDGEKTTETPLEENDTVTRNTTRTTATTTTIANIGVHGVRRRRKKRIVVARSNDIGKRKKRNHRITTDERNELARIVRGVDSEPG